MPIIIKNVWISAGPLKAADRFNIYSWCALGHRVDIYTHHLSHGTIHTYESLGLKACNEIGVTDIGKMFMGDGMTMLSPEVKVMNSDRELILHWLKLFPTIWKNVKIPQLYNIVDMVKSYIGATRQGIVLDTKVGPSEHLQHYEDEFAKRFVSYNRGGQATSVENQCIGTMQKENLGEQQSLRFLYAKAFAASMNPNRATLMKNPTGDHYNLICGIHGRAWIATKPAYMDVAKEGPSKQLISKYKFLDFIGPWYGPFRVFKEPSSQTHKGSQSKGPKYVRFVCDSVLKDFRKGKYTPKGSEPDPGFRKLMEETCKEIK